MNTKPLQANHQQSQILKHKITYVLTFYYNKPDKTIWNQICIPLLHSTSASVPSCWLTLPTWIRLANRHHYLVPGSHYLISHCNTRITFGIWPRMHTLNIKMRELRRWYRVSKSKISSRWNGTLRKTPISRTKLRCRGRLAPLLIEVLPWRRS